MRRLSVALQLGSMFVITLLLMFAILGFTIYRFGNVAGQYQHIAHSSVPRTMMVASAQDSFHQVLGDIRGYLGYADESYAQETQKDMKESLDKVKTFVSGVTDDKGTMEGKKLQTLVEDYGV